MGKILRALKNIALSPETKLEIGALDKRMADLEKYFQDHQTIESEYGSLKKPPAKRAPSQPYDPEQGTGTPPPRVIIRRLK